MATTMQPSLFDARSDVPVLGPLADRVRRHELTDGAWVDVRPGWMSGSVGLFERLRDDVPWRAERRPMYDRVVDVPRLVSTYHERDAWPDPLLGAARDALDEQYRAELPEGFATAGLALYRDGSDSVAWHGDRIGKGRSRDTLVAIVSLGDVRTLCLRPRGGGRSLRFALASGDLLVMGGSCQRTWEHAVPKVRSAGPRMSVQFRPAGVW
ncbi:MAG: alpha-ketoglutarate-dependent dioxygenase AlkB [Actinobacteria bacterium]|nr:alpha-ketoglutarate-dependent dioxygenase AlkB [Actinomycetota bacterium]